MSFEKGDNTGLESVFRKRISFLDKLAPPFEMGVLIRIEFKIAKNNFKIYKPIIYLVEIYYNMTKDK